jgi:Na+-transporting methylmalonyl-CoA/oxaloacetate decarboxylase gamma subunit
LYLIVFCLFLHQQNKQITKMKKVTFAVLALGLAFFTACGPSAEQQAAKEKATQDSIAKVEAEKIAAEEAAAAAAAAAATADTTAAPATAQ